MNEETINKKLQELINEIASLPISKQKPLAPLVKKTKANHANIKENFNKITELLGNLRICLQYLLFDIEATKRERDKLRAQLKNKPPKDDDEPDSASGKI